MILATMCCISFPSVLNVAIEVGTGNLIEINSELTETDGHENDGPMCRA